MFLYRVMVDFARKEYEARDLISYVREYINEEGYLILDIDGDYFLTLESSLVERMNGDFYAKFEFEPLNGEEIDLELIIEPLSNKLKEIANSRVRVSYVVVDIVED